MVLRKKSALALAVIGGASLAAATPVLADVREGVDAWSRGAYAEAVALWEAPAAAGDADAQFNLAQAYRLGRGVSADMAKAEDLYRRAAEAGHVQAADTYGLLLFQDGRREVALPYVEAAARRGDPRAQYLLGLAHFNGDLVARDWERAYALLTLANAQGLPQAAPAIAEMDRHIPLAQRQQAAELAQRLQAEAGNARAVELAQFDLAGAGEASGAQARPAPPPTASVATARADVDAASRATGTESPAQAGATFARTAQPAASPAPARPAPTPASSRPAAPAPTRTAAAAPAAMTGPWKIQLGAFSVASNAERLWSRLSGRSELAGAQRVLVPRGGVTRLLAGGFPSRSAAEAACSSLKRAGHDCLVTQS